MKRICSFLVACVMALSMLCGCGSKFKTTDVETVKNTLVDLGYYDESLASESAIGSSEKIGAVLTNHWTFTFCDFKKDDVACTTEYTLAVSMCDEVTRTEDGNYCVVEYEDDIIYKLIIRVDNTLMITAGPKADREQIKQLARTIGYIE
jgi:hypothetical protein